ncbi:hypothetical protein BDEG_21119 [Batrachochytrium dendrobatidis JEL423]|uniref:Uncharacterized protein n=1 Tax=Batrachochytrium dendrobatidis (strain JEL423) TaxID=403673 RepID=A0A177WAB4_BATDL|nr:hypothetical protein BDEG_21119 [Batrachochytrium dendrobatidis JEL423]
MGIQDESSSTSLTAFQQHLKGFVAGALAACGAVTFTNPWEVVKTRLQLQGELQARLAKGTNAPPKQYPNAFSAFGRIFKAEGFKGIQKGLAPAYIYQTLLNGTRLGLYDPLKAVIQSSVDYAALSLSNGEKVNTPIAPAFAMVTSGAMSGVLGAFIASPLFLIKTRMQSYTKGSILAVGHQHSYVTKGTLHSLATVYRQGGIKGLWRGVDASMMRTGVGSAVQLSSYDGCKQALLQSGWFDAVHDGHGGIALHFMASLATSLLVCIAMNPFDVASTRMYNQHSTADGKTGSLYKSGFDCLVKTVRAEGVSALYKGFFAHYLRIGQVILCNC